MLVTIINILLIVIMCKLYTVNVFPMVVSVSNSTNAFRERVVPTVVIALFCIVMILPPTRNLSGYFVLGTNSSSDFVALVIGVSAIVATMLAMRISVFSSVCYAYFGAMLGWQMYCSDDMFSWVYVLHVLGVWVLAPVISALLAALIYKVFALVNAKQHKHLFVKCRVLRVLSIISLALFTSALGVNNGAVFLAYGGLISGDLSFILSIVIAILALVLNMIFRTKGFDNKIDRVSYHNFNVNTETLVSVLVASSLVLLLFSNGCFVNILHLELVPVSGVMLLLSGLAGVNLLRNYELSDLPELKKNITSLHLSAVIAFVISYCTFVFLKHQPTQYELVSKQEGEFTVIYLVFATLVLVTLFLLYMRTQKRLREEMLERTSMQRIELYENQKAINSMEMRSITSENESLHNKLALKRKELISVALNISEQKEFLADIHLIIKESLKSDDAKEREKHMKEVEQLLRERMNFSQEMDGFYTQVELLHKDFSVRLTEKFPKLTVSERRLTTLLRLGFRTKYIASLMDISPKSVEVARYRLRQKFEIDRKENLINFIKNI